MVQIEQHVWGMTPEGEAIILYTMRNDKGAEVKISNFGAAIVSVTMPDREGRMADVVLGYKHPEGYFFDGAASGKSVGRCANRIAFGRMTVEGKEYALEVNNGPNHLHGGTKNFANRIWESRVETNRVVMSLLSEDGDQNYPGELNVEGIDLALRELRWDGITDVKVVVLSYWDFVHQDAIAKLYPGGFPGWDVEHGGVLETSLMLALHPEHVHLDRAVDHPSATFPPYDVYPVKKEWTPCSGTLSSPKEASAEKGQILLQVCGAGIVKALYHEFGGKS